MTRIVELDPLRITPGASTTRHILAARWPEY
jgi:hypothetical protein